MIVVGFVGLLSNYLVYTELSDRNKRYMDGTFISKISIFPKTANDSQAVKAGWDLLLQCWMGVPAILGFFLYFLYIEIS